MGLRRYAKQRLDQLVTADLPSTKPLRAVVDPMHVMEEEDGEHGNLAMATPRDPESGHAPLDTSAIWGASQKNRFNP